MWSEYSKPRDRTPVPPTGREWLYRGPMGLHFTAEGDTKLHSQNDEAVSEKLWRQSTKQYESRYEFYVIKGVYVKH